MSVSSATVGTSVSVENVSVRFRGGVTALDGTTCGIGRGEFVSIVGPSGCGKSTLLRVVAGLLAPTTGAVTIEGAPAAQARRARHDVAFVFQHPTLLPWRTVERNVRLPLELQGKNDAIATALIRDTLQLVGLADFTRAYPHQLSGGMQMRVSLARALVTHPDLLLLDEPFGALDDITRQRLNEELPGLWARDHFTALFVTHNVSEAVFLSQRVLVMSARPGRIVREHEVPFSFPRDAKLRSDAEFARLCGEIGESLREAYT